MYTDIDDNPGPTTKATPPPLTQVEVKRFLKQLTTSEIRSLGLELGLHHPHLKKMTDEGLLDEMLHCWLREDDIVHEISGTPSWESLIRALEAANFNGVAAEVKRGML